MGHDGTAGCAELCLFDGFADGMGYAIRRGRGEVMKPTDYKRIQKIVKRAHAGGWNPLPKYVDWKKVEIVYWVSDVRGIALLYTDNAGAATQWTKELYTVIFDHDFAKALWGEKEATVKQKYMGDVGVEKEWHYHLQMMVVAPDAIEYLGGNI